MVSLFSKDFINKNRISLLISLILIASFIIENINGRFWLNDFKVYYTAASHLLHGGNIYNEAYGLGSGFYKYSPFAAIFFIPFTFLPYYIASVIYYFIVSALIIYVLNTSLALVAKYYGNDTALSKRNQIILLFVFLATIVHLQRELHLGNVNILLLSILLLALKGLLENKTRLPGLLLAIAILFKPHFLVFLPLLLLRKRFTVVALIVLFIFIGLLVPSFFYGIPTNIFLHKQWLLTMETHNAGILQAEQTIYSIIYTYILGFFLPEPGKMYILTLLFIIAASVLLYIVRHNSDSKTDDYSKSFMLEFFLLLALIPSLTLTDTEHFLLTLPLITLMIYHIRTIKMNLFWLIMFWIGIIFYAGNIHDLLGSNLSAWVLVHGFLGIGNLILIGLYYSITIKK
jgi:hypothetical protein